MKRYFSLLFLAASLASLPAAALKSGNALDAEALSAEEQQKLFTLPEGFSIELVASETTGLPKPVSIAFDDAGRLWSETATMYPRDMDADIWKTPGKDRVTVIDAPHLRELQPVRTFADGMVMPLGVLPYADGALVAQGPEIHFLEDTDHDGKADKRTVLLKDFGVQDTHTLPHQLVRLPGGRIGFSQGVLNSGNLTDAAGRGHAFNKTLTASMTPQGTDLRITSAGLNNIWSWAQTRSGRVFIHEANDLGYSLVPFEEDSSYPSFIASKLHPESPMHPATALGLNLGGTGFSGIAVCDDRAGSFPAPWKGELFVANPVLGTVHAVAGTEDKDGVWSFKKHGDLVACADPMFRPVCVAFGPDGCLYIADWYNRIISHNEVARDHPARDKEHGRIWRVRHNSQPPANITDYTRTQIDQLPAALTSDSTWAMRAAWHQMAQRQDKSVIPALLKLLGDEQMPADVRIAALWSLEELGYFDAALWKTLLTQSDADLRREAVRALTTLKVPQPEAAPLLKNLASETAWTVRYEVLRYFRRAEGKVASETLAWLRGWSATPATKTKAQGQKGEFLALDGSYQRAFQDFLMKLAETKTQLPVMEESKWGRVIAKNPTPADPLAMAERIAAVKAALPNAKPEDGHVLTESICLNCHALGGKGVGFAPPLDGSSSRDLDGLLTAIVDPNAAMENVFRTFRIVTKDGGTIEGFYQGETREAITLLLMGGVPQVIPIKNIERAGYIEGQSMMPDITGSMTPEQVASIAAYLRSLR
jgi:putative membrane-bound dehydrogenase-like protein